MTHRQTSPAGGSPIRGSLEAHGARYYYPPIPTVQSPPAAHLHHGKRFSEGQRTDETRVQSSMSAASVSSARSYQKPQASSPDSQWPSPTLERTLINSDEHRLSQSNKWDHPASSSTSHGRRKSDHAHTSSPTQTYTKERRQIHEEQDDEDDDHAIWVLFWLAVLDPIHSLASCLFTIVVAFGLLLASPIRLVHKQSPLGDQVIRAVAPMFKNHMELMYAESVDHAYEWDFRPGMLIFMHVASPLISMGVAVASWVTAAFWVFTSIMGNPDGTERRDDGADAVLAVRNWWEHCLLKATKPRARLSIRSVV